MNYDIQTWVNNPILRARSQEVDKIDKSLAEFFPVLKKMMRTHDGVGLAAPQIGKNIRVIATTQWQKKGDKKKFVWEIIMINPKLLQVSKETFLAEEACLSVPDVYGYVKRHKNIMIEYMDIKGNKQTKKLKDFNATIVQHEIDHLDGILFVDKIVKQKIVKKK